MIRGRVWCFGDDINTDLIQPSFAMVLPIEEQPRYTFEANRRGWATQVERGDIIVAGSNFGTGSSRPAARVLSDLGIAGVLADSINWLFFRNCVNFALAAIECPGVRAAFKEGELAQLDLADGSIRNVTRGVNLTGRAWPPQLLEIYQAGGLIPKLEAEGLVVK